MCQFCTSHGEGKKWYLNMANYTAAVFRQVNSERQFKNFLSTFRRSLSRGVERAARWQRRLPRLYRALVYPRLTTHLQKTHFGQIVPLEEVESILEQVGSVIRLPCICRRVTLGREERHCLAVGLDLSHLYGEEPDFRDFDRIPASTARELVRRLDRQGMTHSVWTFNTPFIGAICNCDQNCMAYRAQHRLRIARTMWKGEYVAAIDANRCRGCRECLKRCPYGAVWYDRRARRCVVAAALCHGCGICRTVCEPAAIQLRARELVADAAGRW